MRTWSTVTSADNIDILIPNRIRLLTRKFKINRGGIPSGKFQGMERNTVLIPFLNEMLLWVLGETYYK